MTQPQRLSLSKKLSLLHDIANGTPHPEAWRTFCQTLDSIDEDELPKGALEDWIQALDNHWPDDMRSTMCALDWDEDIVRGFPSWKHRVVRSLKYNSVFVGRYGGIMMRSPDVQPGWISQRDAANHWDHLTHINLFGQRLSSEDIQSIAKSPLPHLHELTLGTASTDDIIAWKNAPWIPNLQKLTLSIQPKAHSFLTHIASLPLAQLHTLHTNDLTLTPSDADTFAQSSLQPALRELSLYKTPLSAQTCRALSQGCSHIETLRLSDCTFQPRNAHDLFSDRFQPKHLFFSSIHLGDYGLSLINDHLPNLQTLSLSSCSISDSGLDILARAQHLNALNTLTLDEAYNSKSPNTTTARGLSNLLSSTLLPSLQSISINKSSFDSIHGPILPQLTSLSLSGTFSKTLLWHTITPNLPSIQSLTLKHTHAPLDSILQHLPKPQSLTTLHIHEAHTPKSPLTLFQHTPNLQKLVLSKCGLTPKDLLTLAQSPMRPTHLDLCDNTFDEPSLIALAHSPILSNIQTLRLDNTGLTDAAAIAFAQQLPSLDRFHARQNPIQDQGAQALIKRTQPGGGWMSIDLSTNDLSNTVTRKYERLPTRCCP